MLGGGEKKFLTEHLSFPKTCKDEAEAEEKQDGLSALANNMATFLKAWKKELSSHKNFLEQEA